MDGTVAVLWSMDRAEDAGLGGRLGERDGRAGLAGGQGPVSTTPRLRWRPVASRASRGALRVLYVALTRATQTVLTVALRPDDLPDASDGVPALLR
ncbi:hypothetical protein GCM10020229_15510 [Kitasatospora albolonga]